MPATSTDPASEAETLTEEELKFLAPYTVIEHYEDNEIVFSAGSEELDLFVVKSGKIEVLNPEDNSVVAVHEVGQFAGDIDLLTGRPIIITGRAKGTTEILRVPNAKLHEVLLRVPKLSDKMLTTLFSRRNMLQRRGKLGLKVVGPARCKETTLIREFLYKNFVPFSYYDPNTADGQTVYTELGSPANLPVVQCPNGSTLQRPTLRDIADGAGVWRHCPNHAVDLAIIGAGPAGLAAAVYAASEGLSTLVLDKLGPGGQAGGSSKIENFIGFPSGLSGTELATRGVLQMLKFGAQLVAPVEVHNITLSEDGRYALPLDCGAVISARVVLVAAGVVWRKLDAENADRFERAGVYYACTMVEATLHDKTDVAVVGAGNSAGQAAMYLTECCPGRKVHMVVRSTLGPNMSDYLTNRIRANPDIVVYEHSTIQKVNGEHEIESIDVCSGSTIGATEHAIATSNKNIPVSAIFVFIGAEPSHTWLPTTIERDSKGFLKAGIDAKTSGKWPLKDRDPCPLETTMPNVLVAGDIRSGSTKRVGFAVGDGSLAVTCVHSLLSN
ncbi:MAG: FAD-dependent oxidoreductase [Cyanobacteria bacterium SZAS-4]|nr:FAD-dependent oxidoreductase [Cyanobacteria bacterium SZAS-4]